MAGAATWMLVPGSFVLYLLLFVATSNSLLCVTPRPRPTRHCASSFLRIYTTSAHFLLDINECTHGFDALSLLLALLVALLGFMFAMARVLVLALPAHPIAQLRPKLVTFLAALPFIFLVAGLVLNPTKPLHPCASRCCSAFAFFSCCF